MRRARVRTAASPARPARGTRMTFRMGTPLLSGIRLPESGRRDQAAGIGLIARRLGLAAPHDPPSLARTGGFGDHRALPFGLRVAPEIDHDPVAGAAEFVGTRGIG